MLRSTPVIDLLDSSSYKSFLMANASNTAEECPDRSGRLLILFLQVIGEVGGR